MKYPADREPSTAEPVPSRSGSKILVIASDAVLAALIGRMVEAAHFSPEFPLAEEHADQALARVRPLAAILLDAAREGSNSELFLERARRLGVRVLLFGSSDVIRTHGAWARRHDLPVFSLPDQLDELQFVIDEMARAPGTETRRGRSSNVERRRDGSFVFEDASGMRWAAYDRRGGDRRSAVDRRFVSGGGEMRHCDVTPNEAGATSLEALRDQLARAQPFVPAER